MGQGRRCPERAEAPCSSMLSLKRSGFVVSVVYHAAGVDVSTGAAVSSGFGACLVALEAKSGVRLFWRCDWIARISTMASDPRSSILAAEKNYISII